MKNNIQIALTELQKDLYDLSARNPLLNCKESALHFYENPAEKKLDKLNKKVQFNKKEYALDSLLHIHCFMRWQVVNSEKYYTSPLLISDAEIVKKRKIDTEFNISVNEEIKLNPVWEHYFTTNFDIDIPPIHSIESFLSTLKERLETAATKIEFSEKWTDLNKWTIIRQTAVGVFNYKKSVLGKDFEEIKIQPSGAIKALLTEDSLVESEANQQQTIYNVDASQLTAIQAALNNHLVIQGPPGTGKSHTIVALIKALLLNNKSVLFISEKKSAMDVVYSRLKTDRLDLITAYNDGQKNGKKAFFTKLKKSWKSSQENQTLPIKTVKIDASDIIQYYQKSIKEHREGLTGSIQDILLKIILNESPSIEIKGKLPTLKDWEESLNLLHFLEKRVIQEFNKNHLFECSFSKLHKSAFLDNEPILTLEKRLQKVIQYLNEFNALQNKLNLKQNLKDFTQLCISASVMSMVDNVQMDLLVHGTKIYKSFNNWSKKYELIQAKLNQSIAANKKWKAKPSLGEVIELLDLIKNKRPGRGILGSLKRQRLLNEKFVGFSPQISDEAKIKLLESLRLEWRLRGELEETIIKLNHNLGIENPEHDIKLIRDLRRKLDKVAPNDYMFLLEQENHISVLRELAGFHSKIQELQTLLRFVFDLDEGTSITEIKELAEKTLRDLPLITKWLEEIRNYFSLSYTVRSFIRNNTSPLEHLSKQVYEHSLAIETRFEPLYKELSGTTLKKSLQQILQRNKIEDRLQSQTIIARTISTIKEKEKLLITPASRLKEKEKKEKKALRQAKKILFHEMGKKQQHMPIHTFFDQTEIWLKDWIQCWLLNPLSVSEQLPLREELFDYVIFDESSQIPLEDTIPAIQRAKTVIVVGDEHQMPPSSFFSSQDQPKTLLQQAQLAFKNIMLKWHYRSEHPALIQFSNRLFYENELITFPPVSDSNPIEFVKVEGIFENNVNLIEVKQIIEEVKKIGVGNFERIGIVAFSLQQAELIEKEINKTLPEANKILIRNLENAQGIERDYILISVGYGYDASDNFRMNFGPINQESGLNRLNVLVTRAKTKLIVITSVAAFDFKMSDNAGVQTLQDFLNYAEHGYHLLDFGGDNNIGLKISRDLIATHKLDVKFYDATQQIGFNAFIQHSTGKILLIDPTLGDTEIDDLNTLFGVVEERFTKSMIVLSLDFKNNLKRTKEKILSFFKNE